MTYDIAKIIAFEDGTITEADFLDLFSTLIRTGHAWVLQGTYGRTAAGLIDNGVIAPDGTILQEV